MGESAVALLILPLARTQRTLDIDLRALANILIDHIGQTAPQGYGVPLGVLGALLSLTIENTLGCCQTNSCRLDAAFERADFGIGTYVTYQYNFVDHLFI